MKSQVVSAVLLAAALGFGSSSAQAASILLYDTGVDASGTPLADATGETHYSLISAPSGATGALRAATPGNALPYWVGDDATSEWIGPDSDASYDGSAGWYDYQETFSLAGLNPTTASITGEWASDDAGVVLINGQLPAYETTTSTYYTYTPFSITSDFQSGINTLDFLVYNSGGATGLRVEMTGTAAAVPEPMSWALMIVGFGGMGGGLRMRRAKTAAA